MIKNERYRERGGKTPQMRLVVMLTAGNGEYWTTGGGVLRLVVFAR